MSSPQPEEPMDDIPLDQSPEPTLNPIDHTTLPDTPSSFPPTIHPHDHSTDEQSNEEGRSAEIDQPSPPLEPVQMKDNLDAMDESLISSPAATFTLPPSPPSKSTEAPLPAPPPPPHTDSVPPSPSPLVPPQLSQRNSISSMHSHKSSLSTLPSTSLSSIHLLSALNAMAASKDAKRSQPLQKSLSTALEAIKKSGESAGAIPVEQSVILEPLRLACETKSATLQSTALDCISKLVSHGFFHGEKEDEDVQSEGQEGASPTVSSPSIHLADSLTAIITSTYTESTPDAVALQIVKSLLALVLSSSVPVHHSSLLKAVRTVYNIFMLSNDPINQMVAQGGLTQMVHHVFGRVRIPSSPPSSVVNGGRSGSLTPGLVRSGSVASSLGGGQDRGVAGLGLTEMENGNGSSSEKAEELGEDAPDGPPAIQVEGDRTSPGEATPKITLSSYFPSQSTTDLDPAASANHILSSTGTATPVLGRPGAPPASRTGEEGDEDHLPLTQQERFVKDAFLVFRALCKLTMKPLEKEGDLKAHGMRSKLLALHLILTIVQSHLALFASPNVLIPSSSTVRSTFVQATKQYLCLSLIRNATSSVTQVFELCSEIFWNVLKGLRGKMKKEIEVLLNEIFLSILQLPTFTLRQKSTILNIFLRLAQDPQALVEIYLNYDCDRSAILNVYEQLMEIIAKIAGTHFAPPSAKEKEKGASGSGVGGVGKNEGGRAGGPEMGPMIPPSLTTSAMSAHGAPSMAHANESTTTLGSTATATTATSWAHLPAEIKLRRQALECLVTVLRSLVQWGTSSAYTKETADTSVRESEDGGRDTFDGSSSSSMAAGRKTPLLPGQSIGMAKEDDPETFENAKQRKTTLMEGIKKFNSSPKKGVAFLVEQGFIRSSAPQDIARFLLHADGLNKAMIGEYMGEGEEKNIAVMHCFVDMLDFRNMKFVDALRTFLQSFRLPGESQKIDRYVLKFAERYIAGNVTTEFANADTAYILAFSVIMLNTDAHNKNLKGRRMTKEEFLKNNRGINDGQNLPDAFLEEVFEEIQTNEIKMKDEVEAPQITVAPGLANTLANVGRDIQREAYVLQSEGMSNRTEALFKTMLRQQRRGGRQNEQYYSASHLEHVRPMFEVAWMPVLAALSGPIQETDEVDVVDLCLDGFKHAIRIACFFDLEFPRKAFVNTLTKFTYLNNLGEMKAKNVEAIKALLEIAVSEGNYLKTSWRDILVCVSQLERMQLISNGIDTPDIGRRKSVAKKGLRRGPGEDVASESRSAQVTVAADMVFSSSKHLSGSAIVEFVQALSEVSWEEIQSSSASDHPRLFSLQKLVEISYYNMARIRLEWSGIWQILGEHFNQVCCHNNPNVSFFALDALRQLAMRFLEKDELSHFQFQKDFLKPFEYTMIHNTNSDARDMVLQCLQHMLQARVGNMRSGWRTMFGVFSAASRVLTERVANSAFELVQRINKEHFSHVIRYGAFADLTVCMTDFCKVNKYQKISLQAVEMLRGVVPAMLACPDCALNLPQKQLETDEESGIVEAPPVNDPMVKFWFPLLFAFYDVVMNGEDLEVRRVALDSLFDTLATHGASFRSDFWDSVCQQVLFPIFAPLRAGPMQEDMSFWVSTTMLTALRKLVDLYTFYFEILERFLDPLLELLCFCIDQENDTLARIGTTCFQQLLESNVKKLSASKWERIVSAFVQLFQTTLAHMLFDPNLRSENEVADSPRYISDSANNSVSSEQQPDHQQDQPIGISSDDRRRIFRQIIRKCVLQLLLIETTNELLQNEEVYQTIPAVHLFRFLEVLDNSYQFARKFNADKDLRMALWKVGFMKQLPNLLKQESSSASTLVNNLIRMYNDPRADHRASREGVLTKFIPLSLDIIQDFNRLEAETQARHIAAWSPVVCEILQGYCSFDDNTFNKKLSVVYPVVTDILSHESAPEVRESLRAVFVKIGRSKGIC